MGFIPVPQNHVLVLWKFVFVSKIRLSVVVASVNSPYSRSLFLDHRRCSRGDATPVHGNPADTRHQRHLNAMPATIIHNVGNIPFYGSHPCCLRKLCNAVCMSPDALQVQMFQWASLMPAIMAYWTERSINLSSAYPRGSSACCRWHTHTSAYSSTHTDYIWSTTPPITTYFSYLLLYSSSWTHNKVKIPNI